MASNGDDIVLGIDLGTTFSAMAYVNVYGKPEITVVKTYDVNYDGVVDVKDSDAVLQQENNDPCAVGPILDVNGDGSITPTDTKLTTNQVIQSGQNV